MLTADNLWIYNDSEGYVQSSSQVSETQKWLAKWKLYDGRFSGWPYHAQNHKWSILKRYTKWVWAGGVLTLHAHIKA